MSNQNQSTLTTQNSPGKTNFNSSLNLAKSQAPPGNSPKPLLRQLPNEAVPAAGNLAQNKAIQAQQNSGQIARGQVSRTPNRSQISAKLPANSVKIQTSSLPSQTPTQPQVRPGSATPRPAPTQNYVNQQSLARTKSQTPQPNPQAKPTASAPGGQTQGQSNPQISILQNQSQGVTQVPKAAPVQQATLVASAAPQARPQPAAPQVQAQVTARPANLANSQPTLLARKSRFANQQIVPEPSNPAQIQPQAPIVKPTPKVQPTGFQQFFQSKQKATGSFVHNLFKSTSKQISQPPKEDLQAAAKAYQQGLASIRDLIAPSSLEIKFNHLRLSGVFVRSFFVYAYPRFLDTNWLASIINFDATFEFSQFIYPISSAEIMRTLKKKVAQIQSSITIAREKGNVRDPELETALEDAEQLRTDLQRGQEKFFQLGFYFTVYAEDEKKLEGLTKQLENLLGGRLVMTKRADIRGEHAFNSTLPLAIDELEVERNMNTGPLSTTFPFVSSDLATDDGILYGLNRHNNSLIIFDRFKLPNANSTVFATSGAGKSYAVKLEVLRQVMLGTDVIIIDPENEYQALTETVDGTYLRVSLTSDQRINPFDLPQAFEGQDLKAGDLLRENIIAITGLLKLMLGKVTPAEEALIDEALIETYAVRGITMEIQNPGKMPVPTMEDFHSVLKNLRGAESLATRLKRFTTGTFGGIFNQPTNINFEAGSGLLVFCIRDLEEELRPIAMYVLLNFIWNRVRSQLKRRLLVVDEAWTLMQHRDAARFLYGLVKRARKYYLGITTITQDVEDFLGSPFGRPIVANAALQILLKQSPSSMDVLQKTFNLTEGEKYMLLNSGVGQGLFFADNKHVAIQIIASYSENKIITTNPEEILAQRR